MESLFQELKRYVGFDATDEGALRTFAPVLRPHRERIAHGFYTRLQQHDGARAVFHGAEQVHRLQSTLVVWMEQVVTGPWDEEYFDRRARIGRMHVQVGLPQRYMFVAMNQLREEMSGVVAVSFAGDERLRVERAVNRILDLELAIMLETYAEESASRLQRLERQRSERLSSMGTLAAGLAHEIRNPLNAAHLQLSVLQRRLARRQQADLEAALAAADIVSTEMQRLAALVDEFLQFARPQPPRSTRIDLRTTAESVLRLVAPEAVTAKVTVDLEDGPPVWARADDERLKQVILNLVHNAMEATGAGGHVHVRVSSQVDGVRLEVDDDGPGLPSADAPIFEPFFTTKADGTGLGLAIVERIVSDHGGRISVHSRPGKTSFQVLLPHPNRPANLAST